MATDVVMPQMGESIAEGTVVRWLKKVGEAVERDEPLLEISTDKVDAEIPSPANGTLTESIAQEAQTVGVNTVVAPIPRQSEAARATPPAPAHTPAPRPPPRHDLRRRREPPRRAAVDDAQEDRPAHGTLQADLGTCDDRLRSRFHQHRQAAAPVQRRLRRARRQADLPPV